MQPLKVPSSPTVYTKTLNKFLGVDFTSALPDVRRASNMVNLINNNGYLETRPGYDAVGYNFGEGAHINGIWNVDRDTDSVFIAHVGDSIYLLDDDFDNAVRFTGLSDLNDAISTAVWMDNKLLIFDGSRVLVYKKGTLVWEMSYLDTIGYVPTTCISRSPDGTGSETYEDVNLIQKYRINSFLSDGASATYYLDSEYDDETPTATILQSDGTLAALTVLSYDEEAGTVTFDSIPPVSPVTGRDNVFIRFAVTNTDTIAYINSCNIVTTYGYDGNNNRIFVTGNSDYPNVDWFSGIDDPTYYPANNYTRIGFQPIVSYLRLNDGSLAVLKNTSDTDATVYYRKSATYNGEEVFPISYGVNSIGCIGRFANANFLNDPLTLTATGIYSINGSDYGEKFASERSYYIKTKLLTETNLKNAISIVYQGKYYLAINNHVYVADSRYTTSMSDAYNSSYQYDWYYWDNVPVRIWFIYDNELYFGTEDGLIMKFNTTCLDIDEPIECLYDTAFLDLNSIEYAKSIKRVTVITKPTVATEYTLSYVTNSTATEITDIAYSAGTYPTVLQERDAIRKFMFIRFRLSNDTSKKMSFNQIGIEYIYSGHYRG